MTTVKANPSVVVDYQAPEFIRSDYAKFITFLQKYYQYLEQNDKPLDIIRNLDLSNDIDEQTDDDILSIFYSLFLPDFPQVVAADKKFVLKNIVEFYNSKGSIDSIKSFFRILYGDEVQVYLPKVDVLKLNAGVWEKIFQIKLNTLSSGTIDQLVGSEIYQIDPLNGNKTVRARVVDYEPSNSILYLSADNVVLNFSSSSIVYAVNNAGVSVTFTLYAQLGEVTINSVNSYAGLGYNQGDPAILYDSDSNTENIKIDGILNGTIRDLIIENVGNDYSIFDTVNFGTPATGEIAATARITKTTNKDLVSENSAFFWNEPEDRLLFEDSFEVRQEMGTFGSEIAVKNLKIADESAKNLNTGSISSAEFAILMESQNTAGTNTEVVTYTRSSYTYNQGLFRPILSRVGSESNFSLNWARDEGISVTLNDEELWIGYNYCTEGTPPDPGCVVIAFESELDYNKLVSYSLTERSSSTNPPVVTTLVGKHNDIKILDQKIGNLSELQQIGVYEFGQDTLSDLYPFCENNIGKTRPIIYIRERNTLHGHDINTTRPWEYKFTFIKNSKVNLKIYLMPVQFDIRSAQILDEDGSDYIAEYSSNDTFLLEQYDKTIKVNSFDPGTAVSSNQINIPSHGFKQYEIVKYNTVADPITGTISDIAGGVQNEELFYCYVVDSNNIKLIPYGTTREAVNYSLFRTITPAATLGTINRISALTGGHVTSGVDYTSSSLEDSSLSIYARKITCGNRDLSLNYNLDPNIPTDADTNLRTTYPYTVDNKVYLYQSVNENTDTIVMERDIFSTGDQVNLELEVDKVSAEEELGYTNYPYLCLENSTTTIKQHVNSIDIPDGAEVRLYVERKSVQMVDDINRGTGRLYRSWDDYADFSISQELFCVAEPAYYDEYDNKEYVTAAYVGDTSTYVSGPSEFSNLGSNLMVASSKDNSVYYGDGTGSGQFKFAYEFDTQRTIVFNEQAYYDSQPLATTSINGPLGVTSGSSGPYNVNRKKYFTIGFSLPEELNVYFDIPFEVNLRNIIDNATTTQSYNTRDTRDYVLMQESVFTDSVYKMEDGTSLALEFNDLGFNTLAQGNQSLFDTRIVIEFYSPSLPANNPKKHLIFYSNFADYTKISSDTQRTIYQFYNAWSPNGYVVPDTTIKDYTVTVRSLYRSDYIIEKISDKQLLTKNPNASTVNNSHISPYVRDVFVRTGMNDYGKYIKFYNTQADALADTSSLVPFSLGSEFGSSISGNELFYNPITSGSSVNSAFNNPINKSLSGCVIDKNISISKYFDPATDVTTGSPGLITINNHGFTDGSWVRVRADFNGTLPTGLTDSVTYYVKSISANTIRLASSKDNYVSNTFVNLTAFATPGKTCSLQTIPQTLSYGSVKEKSFDSRKFIDKVLITSVDITSNIITTAEDHTLQSLNSLVYNTSGDSIGGLINNKEYFLIYVSENQLRLAETKADALIGRSIDLTTSGSGLQYIVVSGASGNLLPITTNKEQFAFTPGNYKHNLRNGDEVTYVDQRTISPGIATGSTLYVKDTKTVEVDSVEGFTLTTNSNGTTSNFGFCSTTSASVATATGIITFPSGHTFYSGEEVVYVATTPIGGLTSEQVYNVIRISSTTIKLATSFENAIAGTHITLTTVGSGTHFFSRTNLDTASELFEVIPNSTNSNLGLLANPGVTGTGIEEFSIVYSPTLLTEVGPIETITVTSPGSYNKIPNITIDTPDRYGSGAEIYSLVSKVGAARSFEILDGGIHNVSRTLLLPTTFASKTTTGTFTDGEIVKVGSTEVGTFMSKRSLYYKIAPNGSATLIDFGDTVTGLVSGATAQVGFNYTVTGITLSTSTTITISEDHYMEYGEQIKIIGMSANNIPDGYYYVSPVSSRSFRIYTNTLLTTAVNTSAVGAWDGNGTVYWGMYRPSVTASPKAITTSTANGSTVNYEGDKQLLNSVMKLQDSYYYQDYSYVVRGANSPENWKSYYNKLVHPAGMAVFGEVDYFVTNNGNEILGTTEVVSNTINSTNTAITTEMTTS
jgi:hypothetical protein